LKKAELLGFHAKENPPAKTASEVEVPLGGRLWNKGNTPAKTASKDSQQRQPAKTASKVKAPHGGRQWNARSERPTTLPHIFIFHG
jgi:hypothetical protein